MEYFHVCQNILSTPLVHVNLNFNIFLVKSQILGCGFQSTANDFLRLLAKMRFGQNIQCIQVVLVVAKILSELNLQTK
jgi:hypothetical protein